MFVIFCEYCFTHIVAPEIQAVHSEITITAPNTAILSCTATAKPQATILWISSNEITLGNIKYLVNSSSNGTCSHLSISQCVSSSTLQILNTRVVDSGEYTCVASNEVGNGSANIQLTIQGVMIIVHACSSLLYILYCMCSECAI